MTKSLDFANGIHRDEFESFIAKEVERVLAQYNQVVKTNGLISTGSVAIHSDLAGLASEFLHTLAAEAARRFSGGLENDEVPCLETRNESAHEPHDPHARDSEGTVASVGIEEWAGRVVGSTYLEKTLRIPRSTLYWWQRRNDVVALRKGSRKHVFPLAQFVDGRPVPGLREVLSSIANPRLAWLWLSRPSALLNGRVPVEMLRQDLVADVISAARAFSKR
ncbi:hypothetical protein ACLKMW_16665 [Pseudaminobacter sp. NGMCC 1.201702]|uniref:antitoxin Xre/MbcA/ParS-like domain-containing protein n=1 Tax=Pseudaminobacter sp. NGMCC 1.201702 TaxID=3391825 RepID=UPI0039EE24A3